MVRLLTRPAPRPWSFAHIFLFCFNPFPWKVSRLSNIRPELGLWDGLVGNGGFDFINRVGFVWWVLPAPPLPAGLFRIMSEQRTIAACGKPSGALTVYYIIRTRQNYFGWLSLIMAKNWTPLLPENNDQQFNSLSWSQYLYFIYRVSHTLSTPLHRPN